MSDNDKFIKQYLIQCINEALAGVRLGPDKIEILSALTGHFHRSDSILKDIVCMKKVTEFAKLGIKFSGIYQYLNSDRIDFNTLSDRYNDHRQGLIKELSDFLQGINNRSFDIAINKITTFKKSLGDDLSDHPIVIGEGEPVELSPGEHSAVSAHLSKQKPILPVFEKVVHKFSPPKIETPIVETVKVQKENIILKDNEDENKELFQNYEQIVINPIRKLDEFFIGLNNKIPTYAEYQHYIEMMDEHALLSEKQGIVTLARMHQTLAKCLRLLQHGSIDSDQETIEAMRACLIVIAAMVRNKKIDISHYLTKAEEFGKMIIDKEIN